MSTKSGPSTTCCASCFRGSGRPFGKLYRPWQVGVVLTLAYAPIVSQLPEGSSWFALSGSVTGALATPIPH